MGKVSDLLINVHHQPASFPAVMAGHYSVSTVEYNYNTPRGSSRITVNLDQKAEASIVFTVYEAGNSVTVLAINGHDYEHDANRLYKQLVQLFNAGGMSPLAVLTTP